MENLLNKLYNFEYFSTYLIIAIVVLIILFIVILFMGKKDKKEREIEATNKLQQINTDNAFKEESSPSSVEAKEEVQNVLENDTIIVPTLEGVENVPTEAAIETNNLATPAPVVNPMENSEPIVENTPVEPVEPEINLGAPEIPNLDSMNLELNNNAPDVTPNKEESVLEPTPVNETPLLEKVEESPLVLNESEPNKTIEDFKVEEVAVPDFNFDEVVESVENPKVEEPNKNVEVFSSVYAPKKEENNGADGDEEIELPTLKKEEVEEIKEIDVPVLNDYDLDSLSGETYTINK